MFLFEKTINKAQKKKYIYISVSGFPTDPIFSHENPDPKGFFLHSPQIQT